MGALEWKARWTDTFHDRRCCPPQHIAVMDPQEARAATDAVQLSFAELEAQLAAGQPGLMDLFAVYGQCESALRQADYYFRLLAPPAPMFTATDSAASVRG